MKKCVLIKISFKRLLLILSALLPLAGYAESGPTIVADSTQQNYSHWYFGAEAGLPFLFGDFTSFSDHKTYIGYQFGGLAGYQLNSWVGFELSVKAGRNKMGAKSYASDYYVGEDGMTYYIGQGFPIWKYKEVYSKVTFTTMGAQVNLTLNNFFSENRGNRRWTVLLSPAVYLQHFSPKLYTREDGQRLVGNSSKKWNIGVGGDLALRYKASRLFDVQLRTGISWVNNHRMDGVSTLIKSKDHIMTSAGIAFIWKAGKKGTRDNILYATRNRNQEVCILPEKTEKKISKELPAEVVKIESVKIDMREKELQERIDSLCGRLGALCEQLEQSKYKQTSESERKKPMEVIGFNELPPVYFRRGMAVLDTVLYRNELKRIVKTLKAHPDLQFRIIGYADVTGSREINQRISLQRAEALATWLQKHGVRERQVEVRGECVDDLTSAPNNSSILARRVIIEILN